MAIPAKERVRRWRARMKKAGYRKLTVWLSLQERERLERRARLDGVTLPQALAKQSECQALSSVERTALERAIRSLSRSRDFVDHQAANRLQGLLERLDHPPCDK